MMDDWRWTVPDDDTGAANGAAEPASPSAARALKRAFAASYEYLGLTAAGSLLSAVVLVPAGLLTAELLAVSALIGAQAFAVFALWAMIAAPVVWVLGCGLATMAGRMLDREGPSLVDIWCGARTHWLAAAKLGVLSALVFGALCADAVFFLSRRSVLAVLGAPFLYLLCLWGMAVVYQVPLLTARRGRVLWCAKQSVLLVLDNPLFTVVMCSVIILVVALSAATWLALAVWTPVWLAAVSQSAFRELTAKYEAVQKEGTEGADGFER